jgi:hypothetical protein
MNKLAAVAALAALAFPVTAQSAEMTPEATQAAVRYSLPHLLSGVRATCASRLSAKGYLATNGDALIARFSQGADAAWPQARVALMQMGAKDKSGMADMLKQMPDSGLKPFVDATISTMVATKLKPENCTDVERGLQLLAPLPAENIAGLVGFIFEMAQRDRKSKAAKGG